MTALRTFSRNGKTLAAGFSVAADCYASANDIPNAPHLDFRPIRASQMQHQIAALQAESTVRSTTGNGIISARLGETIGKTAIFMTFGVRTKN